MLGVIKKIKYKTLAAFGASKYILSSMSATAHATNENHGSISLKSITMILCSHYFLQGLTLIFIMTRPNTPTNTTNPSPELADKEMLL